MWNFDIKKKERLQKTAERKAKWKRGRRR